MIFCNYLREDSEVNSFSWFEIMLIIFAGTLICVKSCKQVFRERERVREVKKKINLNYKSYKSRGRISLRRNISFLSMNYYWWAYSHDYGCGLICNSSTRRKERLAFWFPTGDVLHKRRPAMRNMLKYFWGTVRRIIAWNNYNSVQIK